MVGVRRPSVAFSTFGLGLVIELNFGIKFKLINDVRLTGDKVGKLLSKFEFEVEIDLLLKLNIFEFLFVFSLDSFLIILENEHSVLTVNCDLKKSILPIAL